MLQFVDKLYLPPTEDSKQRFEVYHEALVRACAASEPEQPLSSLPDLHTSVSCRLLGELHYYFVCPGDLDDPEDNKRICKHLLGTEDTHAVMQSAVYKEWVSSVLKKKNES